MLQPYNGVLYKCSLWNDMEVISMIYCKVKKANCRRTPYPSYKKEGDVRKCIYLLIYAK